MNKETYYFRHDYNARNDEKILELRASFGAEGYGIFWMIIESMAENENGGVKASLMAGLSLGYGVAIEKLKKIIDYCLSVGLLFEKEGFYFSKRLLQHKEFRKILSENGRKGATEKWRGHSHPNAKERKGKDIKGNKEERVKREPTQDISDSNLFRKPEIPTKEKVQEVFSKQGGTPEMAEKFYNSHEATGWFYQNSPIKNFSGLVPGYIAAWKDFSKDKPVNEYEQKVIEARKNYKHHE